LLGNRNIWTPGQVFEGNFGIDAALEVTRADFWSIVGLPHAPSGVMLNDFAFGYIWRRFEQTRPLPTFKLNLFLQAKRPEGMQNRPKPLRRLGLKSPYWRFEPKVHQQDLLSRLKRKLGNRAFVVYGCAAFHHLKDLYSHITNGTLIQNSTFVKIERLDGHHMWVYDKPGSKGYAMSKPEYVDEENFFDEVKMKAESFELDNDDPDNNLQILSRAIIEICEETSGTSVIARELLERYQRNQGYVGSDRFR